MRSGARHLRLHECGEAVLSCAVLKPRRSAQRPVGGSNMCATGTRSELEGTDGEM